MNRNIPFFISFCLLIATTAGLVILVVKYPANLRNIGDLIRQETDIINSNHVVLPPFWIVDIEKKRDFIRLQLTDPSDRQKYDEIQKKMDKEPWLVNFFHSGYNIFITLLLFFSFLCFIPQSKLKKLIARMDFSEEYYIYRWIAKTGPYLFLYRIIGFIALLIVVRNQYRSIWTWIDLYYPHDKYGSEVDAAIITTFGSTFTLGLTLIITAYFNRQTQKAMLEQSRANLKEKVIETRLKFYPQLEQSLREIGELFPEQIQDQKWTKAINELEQLYNNEKYYMSKKLREKVQDLLRYIKTLLEELRLSEIELSALVEWRSASSHEELSKWRSEQMKSIEESTIKQIEKADQTLDQLIETCLEDIEKSMDLSSLVDLD